MIGNSEVGKSSLIKKIIGMKCSLISKSIEPTYLDASQHITTTLCINNSEYYCTFIELFTNFIGLIVNTNQRRYLERANLIMYVCRLDCFTYEEKEDFKKYINFFKDAQKISALVITGCENYNDEERLNLVKGFQSNESTKEIAASMQRGIYTVGFPDLTNYPMWSKEALENTAQKDVSKLHELIEYSCSIEDIQSISTQCLIL